MGNWGGGYFHIPAPLVLRRALGQPVGMYPLPRGLGKSSVGQLDSWTLLAACPPLPWLCLPGPTQTACAQAHGGAGGAVSGKVGGF